ncbi:MAG: alpha/beta hydrolase [Oscillospiraceae bacterium]|jgi:pimeloyl-ACP methyl ester carboxylesterase|nr:alpha/beta hydrolase [Oscillospiraceae bacterium]
MSFQDDIKRFSQDNPKTSLPVSGGFFEYYIEGDAKKSLVLLPGHFGEPETLFKHIDSLKRQFKVLAISYPPEIKTNDALGDAIAKLISFYRLTNVYVYGQGYGGLLAMNVAKRHPELISGLILEDVELLTNALPEDAKKKFVKDADLKARLAKVQPPSMYQNGELKAFLKPLPEDSRDVTYLTDLASYTLGRSSKEKSLAQNERFVDLLNNQSYDLKDFENLKSRVLIMHLEKSAVAPEKRKELESLFMYPIVNRLDGNSYASLVNPSQSITFIRGFLNAMPLLES